MEKNPSEIRYQADESPPFSLSAGLGFQLAILTISGIVLTPFIIIQAANGSPLYTNWAVFAAVLISGITTIIQAVRVGRVGAGYVLAMGTSGAFIAISVTALVKGGPGLLATLVIISSLFQFILSERLSLFRQILTPTVSGVVIMLIAVTVMPIAFDMMDKVPEGTSPLAAPMSALVTFLAVMFIALKATGILRLWSLVIGVILGSLVGGYFGIYDMERVINAPWVGLPDGHWPGFNLNFGVQFWTLLPAFIFVTLIGAIETVGDGIAIQRVSWRKPRAIDFKAVQGAVAADGLGNLLSGLAGTIPNTTYSSSISVTELTGVASRKVGILLGSIFILFALSPKFLSLILAIPTPVAAAYIVILLAILFVVGMRVVVQNGMDYRKSIIVGVAFWIGTGFQNNAIFPDYISQFAGGLLQNGMTSGGLVAILLTLFFEFTQKRPQRIEVDFSLSHLPEIRGFLKDFATSQKWGEKMQSRLDAVSEETLLSLLNTKALNPKESRSQNTDPQNTNSPNTDTQNASQKERELKDSAPQRRLLLTVKRDGHAAVLEFVAAMGDENLQDQVTYLSKQVSESSVENESSLRILNHLASSVRHQKYHNTDIVTIRVET